MAQKVYPINGGAAGTGSFSSQNSVQKLRVRYIPLTPIATVLNGGLSSYIDPRDLITLSFQSVGGNGTKIIGSRIQFDFLAHVEYLNEDILPLFEFVEEEGDQLGHVKSITFNIPLFEICNRFNDGDNLTGDVIINSGASVEIYGIASPIQAMEQNPYEYTMTTVVAGNKNVVTNIQNIFIPNQIDWELDILGNATVQFQNIDIIASLDSTNSLEFLQLANSNYLSINLTPFPQVDLRTFKKDGFVNLSYYSVKKGGA